MPRKVRKDTKVSPINAVLAIEEWQIDRPKDYPLNARKWSAQALDKVAKSLQAYGWRQPLVVDGDGVLIIGGWQVGGKRRQFRLAVRRAKRARRRGVNRRRRCPLTAQALLDEFRFVVRIEGHKWMKTAGVIDVGPDYYVHALNLRDAMLLLKGHPPAFPGLEVRLNRELLGWRLFRK